MSHITYNLNAHVARVNELETARKAALQAQVAKAETFGRDVYIAMVAIVAIATASLVYFA
jgi:hypothetical protein